MKKFQIWMEGFEYCDTKIRAQLIGEYCGYDFRDAVMRFYAKNPCNTFDPLYLKDWQCQLFPTEEEARRSYG